MSHHTVISDILIMNMSSQLDHLGMNRFGEWELVLVLPNLSGGPKDRLTCVFHSTLASAGGQTPEGSSEWPPASSNAGPHA